MKKLFILALFVLGMCNAPVFGMEREIVLTELYSIMPWDDPDRTTIGRDPDPTQIRATIDGIIQEGEDDKVDIQLGGLMQIESGEIRIVE